MPLPLWLHLKLSALASPASQHPETRPATPGGRVWLRMSAACGPDVARLIVTQLMAERPALSVILSHSDGAEPDFPLPEGVSLCAEPGQGPADMRAALTAWNIDLLVLAGLDLPAALLTEAQLRGCPVVMIDAGLSEAATTGKPCPRLAHARKLLKRIESIHARSEEDARRLVQIGAAPNRVESHGSIEESPAPLGYSERQRSALQGHLRTRPIWLAAALPEDELPMVLAAQTHALRHTHRLLLVLSPAQEGDADRLQDQLRAEGWRVSRRSFEGEPDEETQIFIADDPDEYGLWYRLAPITYMGGSMTPGGKMGGSQVNGHHTGRSAATAQLAARSPMEPARLGSAVLHGPEPGPFQADYQRLSKGHAARRLNAPEALGDAVADLIAPQKAALLAHNAWAVASEGAEATQQAIRLILTTLDKRRSAPATPAAGAPVRPPAPRPETR